MEIEALQEQIRFRQAISCESIIDYYFMQVQKLSFILSLPEDIILLHEARKIIKRLLLPIPFLPPAIHNKLGIDVQTFDRIQQEIGDMHDAVITSELIKEKECDPGYPAGIKDYNILNFYTTIRTGFSIN